MLITKTVSMSANGGGIKLLRENNLLERIKVNCPTCNLGEYTKAGKRRGLQYGVCNFCSTRYKIEHIKPDIDVPVELLPKTSEKSVTVKCDVCNKNYIVMYSSYCKTKSRYLVNLDECKECIRKSNKAYSKQEPISKRLGSDVSWVNSVKQRDLYTCQACGTNEDLCAHHIIPWRVSKQLRDDLDNGITLCNQCHLDYHCAIGGTNRFDYCNQDTLNRFINDKLNGLFTGEIEKR